MNNGTKIVIVSLVGITLTLLVGVIAPYLGVDEFVVSRLLNCILWTTIATQIMFIPST